MIDPARGARQKLLCAMGETHDRGTHYPSSTCVSDPTGMIDPARGARLKLLCAIGETHDRAAPLPVEHLRL